MKSKRKLHRSYISIIVGQYNLQFHYIFLLCAMMYRMYLTGKNVAKISIEEGIEIIHK